MLTIHKASAGSGKTYTLTYTYIKMLLGEKTTVASIIFQPTETGIAPLSPSRSPTRRPTR